MAGHVNKKDWKKQLQQKKDFPYSFEELLGYYGAMYSAYKNVLATKPDAIIAPLRGAFPLVKTLQFFASIEGKTSAMPKVYYPRTGELTAPTKKRSFDKLVPNYAPSMAIGRRKKELRLALELAIVGSKKRHPKVVLLDEVFAGGSISTTYSLLEEVIRENKLKVKLSALGIASRERKKCEAYVHLVATKKIKPFEVPRLFTIDSPWFVYPIIERKPTPRMRLASFASAVFPKALKRLIRNRAEDFLGTRPALGVSRKALHGRLDLFRDLNALYEGKASGYAHIERLPHGKPNHKKPKILPHHPKTRKPR